MASLFYFRRQMQIPLLGDPDGQMEEHCNRVFAALQRHGFSNVLHENHNVHAGRNGLAIMVRYLEIDMPHGPLCWEIVMAGGDDSQATNSVVQEVAHIIATDL